MIDQQRIAEERLQELDRHAHHQIQEIRRLLVPNLRDLMRNHLDAEQISRRIQAMPKAERDLFNLKLSLALADVTSLQDSLQQYRNLIAAEIQRHHAMQKANASYAKSLQHGRPGRVN